MSDSMAILIAQQALGPHGLSKSELAADVILALTQNTERCFFTDDGMVILVKGGAVIVIPAHPHSSF